MKQSYEGLARGITHHSGIGITGKQIARIAKSKPILTSRQGVLLPNSPEGEEDDGKSWEDINKF